MLRLPAAPLPPAGALDRRPATIALALAGAVIGSGLAVVHVAADDPAVATAFLAGAIPAALALVRPRWIPPLFVALVWASADDHLPRMALGLGGFSTPALTPVQLGLGALAVVAAVAATRRTEDARAPLLAVALMSLPLVAAGLASPEGAAVPTKALLELSFLPVVALCARGAADAERAAVALCLVGAVLGVGAVFSVVVHPTGLFPLNETNLSAIDAPRAAGPFGEANFFALSLATLAPLAGYLLLRPGRRVVGAVAAPALLAGILATGSRGAALSAVVGVLLFAAVSGDRKARWAAGALVACGLVLLPLFGGQAQTSKARTVGGRVTENRIALAMFADDPVLGVGPGRYPQRYRDYARRLGDDGRPAREPHSLPLQIAAEQGLAGMLGWIAAVLVVASTAARRRVWDHLVGRGLVAALATYATGSLFLHGSQLRLPFMLAGLLLAVGGGRAKPDRSREAGGRARRSERAAGSPAEVTP